jgi:serine phosphatase RsbU (regulator of sigma subunit)
LLAHGNDIYVGSQGDFGILKADDLGRYTYLSLANQLNDSDKIFSSVWKTLKWGNSVVFQSYERIFIYTEGKIEVVNPQTSFHLAFVVDNHLLVRQRDVGLMEVKGTKAELLPDGEQFSDIGVFAIISTGSNNWLVVTRDKGIFRYNGKEIWHVTEAGHLSEILIKAGVFGGCIVHDGRIAFITLYDGVVMADTSLNLYAWYSKFSGLKSADIRDLVQDKYGNLWLATQKGVSKVEYASAVSFFEEGSGLLGNVQAAAWLRDSYVAGTSEGLFIARPSGTRVFQEIPSLKGSIWEIEQSGNGIYVAASDGLWYLEGETAMNIAADECFGLLYIPEHKWMLAVFQNRVLILSASNGKMMHTVTGVHADALGMAYSISANGTTNVWIGSRTSGVWNIAFTNINSYEITNYKGEADGLPDDWVACFNAGNEIRFGTYRSMLKFVSTDEIFELINDASIDKSQLRGYFDLVDFPESSEGKSVTAFLYSDSVSYISQDFGLWKVQMKDTLADDADFRALKAGRINQIGFINNKIAICGDDGLAIIDVGRFGNDTILPSCLIRKISAGEDSVYWFGDRPYHGASLFFPFGTNKVRVELACGFSENGTKPEFGWRIDGVEDSIRNWTHSYSIDLPELHEGDYRIVFASRDIYGRISKEVCLNITIYPPWYRTWLAYIGYVFAGLLLIFVSVKINGRRLEAKNRKLEEIVEQRTKEVVAQKKEIEIQKDTIEEILWDIRASISYAQRIQKALLPAHETLKEYFPENFILFRPRDVVSGDFYWVTRVENKLVVTVADCTGHGVPGAFMSMLGISFLNEIVVKNRLADAASVLFSLRAAIIEALKQTGEEGSGKDGMDMSLCIIDTENSRLQWAGANNPLYYIPVNSLAGEEGRNDSLVKEIKPDSMPVAYHPELGQFTNHIVELQKGDRLYLFTDGYPDQFGGEKGKKLFYRPFRAKLAETSAFSMEEQGALLEKYFDEWTNCYGVKYEQVDDVTIVGIMV